MINLDKLIDVFIITNGRSTYEYCKKSVDNQIGVKFRITIIRDMGWQEAHKEILKKCSSRFVLRVDDDMLLHPLALKFMYKCVKNQNDKIALRGWRLWEPWSDKVCKGIKVYNIDIAKRIGFHLDHLGKIDKPFAKNAEKAGYKIKYSQDVVAIHSCGNFQEHLKYWKMRGEMSGNNFKVKHEWAEDLIKRFSMTLKDQHALTGNFMTNLNKKRKAPFGDFIN